MGRRLIVVAKKRHPLLRGHLRRRVNPITYAELSIGYESAQALDDALAALPATLTPLPYRAAFLAGRAFITYRRRGGAKTSPLPDFPDVQMIAP